MEGVNSIDSRGRDKNTLVPGTRVLTSPVVPYHPNRVSHLEPSTALAKLWVRLVLSEGCTKVSGLHLDPTPSLLGSRTVTGHGNQDGTLLCGQPRDSAHNDPMQY